MKWFVFLWCDIPFSWFLLFFHCNINYFLQKNAYNFYCLWKVHTNRWNFIIKINLFQIYCILVRKCGHLILIFLQMVAVCFCWFEFRAYERAAKWQGGWVHGSPVEIGTILTKPQHWFEKPILVLRCRVFWTTRKKQILRYSKGYIGWPYIDVSLLNTMYGKPNQTEHFTILLPCIIIIFLVY